jgi:hypothetical protein
MNCKKCRKVTFGAFHPFHRENRVDVILKNDEKHKIIAHFIEKFTVITIFAYLAIVFPFHRIFFVVSGRQRIKLLSKIVQYVKITRLNISRK